MNKLNVGGFLPRDQFVNVYFFYLPHILTKEKFNDLIEWSFEKEGLRYIACNERNAFFASEHQNRYKLWPCQNMCEALTFIQTNY